MFGGMSSMADKETGHENEMSFESALENYLNPDFGDLEEALSPRARSFAWMTTMFWWT